MKNKFFVNLLGTFRPAVALIALLSLPFACELHADSSPASLTIRHTGSDFEGLQEFELEWNAISNATYGVQVSTNLESGSWETIDLVTPASNVGSYRVPPSIRGVVVDKHLFSRLILPQPQIFAVEPAIFPPGAPVDAYVIGQCFETNDTIRVDGSPVAAMLHLSPNQFHGPLPPLSVGSHLVELVRDGVVKSSFTVTCADPMLNPELVLQEPPDEPPATPSQKQGKTTQTTRSNISNNRGSASVPTCKRCYRSHYGRCNIDNNRTGSGGGGGAGGSFDSPHPDLQQGRTTQTTRSNISNNRSAGGVSPFSGEVQLTEADLIIPGRGLDFIWARTYNSRIGRGSAPNGWTFSYDVNIQPVGGDILIHNGTGREDRFTAGTNDIYTCPEFFAEGSLSNNVFKLTHADSGYWEFKPLTASADAGKLSLIVDRNGNTMSLHYDLAGKLTQIVDDLDRTNTVAHNVAGQLESVTDFSGRMVRYEYDGNGDLVRVISPPVTGTPNGNDFPGGKTNSYTYSSGYLDDRENHLLLTERDATGTIKHEHVYQHNQSNLEFLRCISAQDWTNPPMRFSYLSQTPTPANGFATVRCIVNDPVGNVTEYLSDARGRCVTLQEFTGRATPGVQVTDTVNRPANKLRPGDPESYTTTFAWNVDSLCTLMTLPDGSREEVFHQRAYNQNNARSNTGGRIAQHNGDVRVIRQFPAPGSLVDYDGDGVSDATERVWRFEYDDRFGSPDIRAAESGWYFPIRRGVITFDGVSHGERRGSREQIKQLGGMRSGINEPLPFATLHVGNGIKDVQVGEVCDDSNNDSVDGFVISATDPRGNVTASEFDSNGNLTRRIVIPVVPANQPSASPPEARFVYNPHGQLTAITNVADANGYRAVTRFVFGDDPFTPQTEPPLPFAFMTIEDDSGLKITNRFEYDPRGNPTRHIDPLGHDWLFDYNALDQCVRVQTPTNITARTATDFYYDANNNLVRTTTELRDTSDNLICGKTDHFRVNPLGQITRIESAVDCSTFMTNDFVYDGNSQCVLALGGDAVSGADPHQAVAFEYDERGLLFREIGAPGSGSSPTNEWSYTANYHPATKKYVDDTATPLTTTFTYDGFAGFARWTPLVPKPKEPISYRLKVWQLMQGQNGSQAMRSNQPIVTKDVDNITQAMRSNQPIVTKDVDNITTAGRRLSKITDPMGNVTTFSYDANDNLKVVRHFGQPNDVPGTNGNILLAQSSCIYDGLDRLVTQHDAHFNIVGQTIGDGYRTTSFAYAPNGQCTGVTDDLGRTTAFYYDTAGRGTNVTSPNQKTSFAILLNGNGDAEKCTRTDRSDLGGPPQVFTWTNKFDSLGRCISTVDNVGNTNLYAYDSLSLRVRVKDANGVVSFRSYDMLGRQTLAVTDLNNDGLADFVHDITSSSVWSSSNGRLLATSDSHGNPTSYGYDSLGRTTSITNADNTRVSLVWSPRSNLIQETDPNGTVIIYTYDANDRCISNNITPGAGVATTTTFETFAYDGSSRLIAAANDSSTCTFTYDSHNNLVSETRNSLTTSSTYDALGNRLSLTYPGGRALTYAYNALDACTNILESSVSLVSFDYDSPERLARISYANGMRTRIFYDGISGTPNASGDFGHGQVSRILHAMNGGSPQISEVRLAWDRNGNKIQQNDAIFQPAIPSTNLMVLNYDAADRLVESAVVSGSTLLRDTVYGLDREGNRTNVIGVACSGPYTMSSTIPPADSQMNQYTTTPCDSRTYDENGNLTGRGNGALSFVSYGYDYAGRLVSVNDSGNPIAEYAYDALGRRIAKMVFDNGGGPPVTTEFCFDGGSVIEERVNNAVIAALINKSEDGLTILSVRNGQSYFHHTDDQGNTLALTTTGGVVAERYLHDDYGAVTFLTSDGIPTAASSSAVGNPYCWQDLRLEAETGLHNDDGGNYFEPQSDCLLARREARNGRNPQTGKTIKVSNNPWSGGGSGGVFSKVPRSILKSFFETGDKPTQGQFSALIDSMVNYPDDRYSETVEVRVTNSVGTSTAVSGGR